MPDRAPRPPSGDPIPAHNMDMCKSWPLKPNNIALSRSDQKGVEGPKSNDCIRKGGWDTMWPDGQMTTEHDRETQRLAKEYQGFGRSPEAGK